MALKTWLWNLGAAGTAVAAAGCGPAVALPGDTEGSDTEGTDTVILPTNSTETEPHDTYYDTHHDTYSDTEYGYDTDYNYDTYGYDTEYGYDTDYGYVECYSDDDCDLGECIDPGRVSSYCDVLPIPQPCAEDVALQLAWVRQGEGSGTAVDVAGRGEEVQTVVLLDVDVDGGSIPVAVAPVEANAVAQGVPVALGKTEQVTGLEQADLDGDADLDLLVSVRDEASMRVVPLLRQGDGTFIAGTDIVFEAPGAAAKLRRLAGGGLQLLTRLDSGLLFEASGLGDGTFSTPTSSGWVTEPIADFAVAPLDIAASDDVLAAVLGPEEGQSSLGALIDAGELPVGVQGNAARSVFVDAWLGHFLTVDTSLDEFTYVQAAMLGVNASPSQVLVPRDATPLAAVVTDVDGDGASDLVSVDDTGRVSVVFQVARTEACTQSVVIESVFETALISGSGSEHGVLLTGPDGVLSVRGG